MTEINQIYKCNFCGNIAEMAHAGGGELTCCGQIMELKQEKSEEEGVEKHKPVIERTTTGVIVRVGAEPHPMESAHHISWIEVITEHRTYRKGLNLAYEPWAEFFLDAENIKVRAYCNVHGLWSSN
jgi:superoxide reductase